MRQERADSEARAILAATGAAAAGTCHWLLWPAALIALALGISAFLLWGTNSADYLLELAAAYCA